MSSSRAEFERLKGRFLGREKGLVPELFARLKALPPAERARPSARAPTPPRRRSRRRSSGSATDLERRRGRVAGSAPPPWTSRCRAGARATGGLHPITIVRRQIEGIFLRMGYSIADGPEIENDFHNFEALNFPPDHPARDSQDTLLVDRKAVSPLLLRTHTSPVQIREMRQPRRAAAHHRAGPRLPQGRGRRDALAGLPPGRGPRRGPRHLDGGPEGHGRRLPRGALRPRARGRASSRRSSRSSSPAWTCR